MSCHHLTFPDDGSVGFVCTRTVPRGGKRHYCADCLTAGAKVEAVKLCDGPSGSRPGATCDRGMCAEHVASSAKVPGPGGATHDLCSRCAPQGAPK